MQCEHIQCESMQCEPAQCETLQCEPAQCEPMQCEPTLCEERIKDGTSQMEKEREYAPQVVPSIHELVACDNIDDALAVAQGMESNKRKFRGRVTGGERKKRKRGELAVEHAKINKERVKRTVFVNNLAFHATSEDLAFLKKCGDIEEIRLGLNRSTHKQTGYAHVLFADKESAERAVALYGVDTEDADEKEDAEIRGRRVVIEPSESVSWFLLPSTLANRVGPWKKAPRFKLPLKMENDLVRLFIEKKYEGKNLSCLKTAYEKTLKIKADVGKFGFSNFSAAIRTISRLRVEKRHLTLVAYLADEPLSASRMRPSIISGLGGPGISHFLNQNEDRGIGPNTTSAENSTMAMDADGDVTMKDSDDARINAEADPLALPPANPEELLDAAAFFEDT
eukprot:GEMP01034567.1.p1 GENE.GEMP01034567.1~~GEMP01034567.1.p1  ORF type:complete len:395 (+),score=81.28 GEMP01034567.1:368-1552(+)